MATFEGSITFDYIASGVKDKQELDKKLDRLIDLLARRSNDLDGVNWDNVNWTYAETDDTCQTCHGLIEGGNPFSTQCDACLDRGAN